MFLTVLEIKNGKTRPDLWIFEPIFTAILEKKMRNPLMWITFCDGTLRVFHFIGAMNCISVLKILLRLQGFLIGAPPIGITWNGIFVARMSQIGYGHGGRKVFWGIWISWDTIHTSHLTLTFWAKVARALTFKRRMSNLNLKNFPSKFWTRLLILWWKISYHVLPVSFFFIGWWPWTLFLLTYFNDHKCFSFYFFSSFPNIA